MLKNFHIKSTETTPDVIYNVEEKRMTLDGKCMPEDVNEFFGELETHIDNYNDDKLTIVCNLVYINSASNKKLFELLRKGVLKIKEMDVVWISDDDDDDMMEQGENYEHALGIKFKFGKHMR